MYPIDFIEQLKLNLTQALPGAEAHSKMLPTGRSLTQTPPSDARISGVMILLYELDKQWNTILIRRTEDGLPHSGQISFPGGKKEPSDPDLTFTACRECEEEIGVPIPDIELVGTLSTLYIPPSNFLVTPSVGYIKTLQNFKASEREVQEIIQLPLDLLFDHRIKKERIVVPSSSPTQQIKTPVYELGEDLIVWGATAMIIAELESIIETIRQAKS